MMVVHGGRDERAPILVVDDDHEVLAAITEMLRDEGIPAIGAHGMREAEEVARAHRPSLVLLDWHLGADAIGAAETLSKPFHLEELLQCVERHRLHA
jgi:DNA-binding response OmpR family regulator